MQTRLGNSLGTKEDSCAEMGEDMIGDLILFIKKIWLQHFICRHDYYIHVPKIPYIISYKICHKCDKGK